MLYTLKLQVHRTLCDLKRVEAFDRCWRGRRLHSYLKLSVFFSIVPLPVGKATSITSFHSRVRWKSFHHAFLFLPFCLLVWRMDRPWSISAGSSYGQVSRGNAKSLGQNSFGHRTICRWGLWSFSVLLHLNDNLKHSYRICYGELSLMAVSKYPSRHGGT